MIWSMEAKVGKSETEIQSEIGIKNKQIHKKIDNFVTEKERKIGLGPNESGHWFY